MLKKYVLFFVIFSFTCVYAQDKKLLANGYWLRKDTDTNTNTSIIYAYNNSRGNLNARVFVPLSDVENDKVQPPFIYCKKCGKGNAYGNVYDYSSGKNKFQGIEVVWNAKKSESSLFNDKGPLYKDGAVLNPHDGSYYHMKAQTVDNGNKIYVRAFWGLLGRDEYWERIPRKQAIKIRKLCGLTKNNVYTYENKRGEIEDQKLFKECSTRDFIKNPL